MNKPSLAAKVHMIMELLETEKVCPTCGNVEKVEPLITKEEALKLLNIEETNE